MKNEFHNGRKRRGGFWGRLALAAALALGLTVTMTPASMAAESGGETPQCSLTVKCGESSELQKAGIALQIDLYRVAELSVVDGGGYSYIPTENFTDMDIAEAAKSEEWSALAQEAARKVLDPDTGKQKAAPYKTIETENKKSLDAGLYLLIARGESDETYVAEKEDQIITRASGDNVSYAFTPVLVSVPGRDAATKGLKYDVEISLKAEQEEMDGSLRIVKTLTGEDKGVGAVTFVFDVEAKLKDKTVYSNVVSLVFNGPGEQSLQVDGIPVGAEVTVTEVYSGVRCKLTTNKTQTATIAADQIASVFFENTYDDRQNGGQSITNHFHKDTAESQWKCEQIKNGSQG